jgi:hypothetical protein
MHLCAQLPTHFGKQGPKNIFNVTKYDGCTSFFEKPPLSEGLQHSPHLPKPQTIKKRDGTFANHGMTFIWFQLQDI